MTCQLPDGMIVEGIVDLAFEEHGTWIVVDYKTDREFAAGGEERYRRQVALYAAAIPLAFVHQAIADGVYVFVALMWLVPDRRIESRLHG